MRPYKWQDRAKFCCIPGGAVLIIGAFCRTSFRRMGLRDDRKLTQWKLKDGNTDVGQWNNFINKDIQLVKCAVTCITLLYPCFCEFVLEIVWEQRLTLNLKAFHRYTVRYTEFSVCKNWCCPGRWVWVRPFGSIDKISCMDNKSKSHKTVWCLNHLRQISYSFGHMTMTKTGNNIITWSEFVVLKPSDISTKECPIQFIKTSGSCTNLLKKDIL